MPGDESHEQSVAQGRSKRDRKVTERGAKNDEAVEELKRKREARKLKQQLEAQLESQPQAADQGVQLIFGTGETTAAGNAAQAKTKAISTEAARLIRTIAHRTSIDHTGEYLRGEIGTPDLEEILEDPLANHSDLDKADDTEVASSKSKGKNKASTSQSQSKPNYPGISFGGAPRVVKSKYMSSQRTSFSSAPAAIAKNPRASVSKRPLAFEDDQAPKKRRPREADADHSGKTDQLNRLYYPDDIVTAYAPARVSTPSAHGHRRTASASAPRSLPAPVDPPPQAAAPWKIYRQQFSLKGPARQPTPGAPLAQATSLAAATGAGAALPPPPNPPSPSLADHRAPVPPSTSRPITNSQPRPSSSRQPHPSSVGSKGNTRPLTPRRPGASTSTNRQNDYASRGSQEPRTENKSNKGKQPAPRTTPQPPNRHATNQVPRSNRVASGPATVHQGAPLIARPKTQGLVRTAQPVPQPAPRPIPQPAGQPVNRERSIVRVSPQPAARLVAPPAARLGPRIRNRIAGHPGAHPAQIQLQNNAANRPGRGDILEQEDNPNAVEHEHAAEEGLEERRRVMLVGAVKALDRHKPTLAMFPPGIQVIMTKMAPKAKSKIIAYGTYDYTPSDGGHEVPSREDIVTAAWESACKELKKTEPYDPVYGKWIDGLITTFRNQAKKAIKPILDDHHKFTEADPDGNLEKYDNLLPHRFHQGLPEEDRRPFESPFLVKACREVVFVGSDAWALKHPKLFEPFRPRFIAFICAITNHIIEAYREGRYNSADQLDVRTQTQAFRKYLALLTDMEQTRRNAFFKLFRDMYNECRLQVSRNLPKSPSPSPPRQWSPDIEENEFGRAGFPPSDDESERECSDEDMGGAADEHELRLDDADFEIDEGAGGDEDRIVHRAQSRNNANIALAGLRDDEDYEGESDGMEVASEAGEDLCPSNGEMAEYEGEQELEFDDAEIADD
ncbi:hypothetical protein FRC08_015731 [Ceratobasidium sp. 394]|nr:hypothetical protein FRC08_015731 [Ceratobasidium sp. 394]